VHGKPTAICEEKIAGQGTDGARYLAAGAASAFLVTADADELGRTARALLQTLRADNPASQLIFESNRIVEYVRPDVCLAVAQDANRERKASFARIEHHMDAVIARAGQNCAIGGAAPVFHIAAFEKISAEMRVWLLERLRTAAQARTE
jgi:hypothetical protein